MKRTFTVREIAVHVGGEVVGDPERLIRGVAAVGNAGPDDLVFVDQPRYAEALQSAKAGAVLHSIDIALPPGMSGIRVRQPALAMAMAVELIVPPRRVFSTVSPAAHLGEGVELGPDVGIGPGAYIGDGVRIGRGTEIHPGATVAQGCQIGEDCVIFSGVHIYHETRIGSRVIIHSGSVIGADGFGFVQEKVTGAGASPLEPIRHRKMRQVGRVVIEDDVEIGANTAIDRAALDVTRVGKGTKIDNLVQVGHNSLIGRHCVLVGQSGVSGSTELGSYVTLAGQSGVAGHLKIGDRAVVGAQSGVTKDIASGQIVLGSPAIDARQARKALTLIDSLPEFKKTLAAHERRLQSLEGSEGPAANSGGDGAS